MINFSNKPDPRCGPTYRRRTDPWVAIMRAYKKGVGVHLSAEEVDRLGEDDAIASAAESCNTECVCDIMRNDTKCNTCDPSERL